MIYYWILFILIIFLCYLGAKTPTRNRYLFVTVLLFFVFFAFRIGFTPDYGNYEIIFDDFHNATEMDNTDAIETGFQWLCMLLPTYRAMLILYTLLYCSCLYITLRDFIESRYWTLAYIILFFYTPFVLGNQSGMRSGIVTCFFFFAMLVKSKYNGKIGLIVSIAIMLLASTFHRSGLVLMPLLFMPKRALKQSEINFLYVIAAVFIVGSLFFANSLNKAAMSMTDFIFEENNFYTHYFNEEIESGFSFFSILKTIILALLFYITLNFTKTEFSETKNLYVKYTALFYLLVLAPGSIGLITRFRYYFAFPCIIGSCFLVGNVRKNTRLVYIVCIVLFAFWQVYNLLRSPTVMSYYSQYNNILFL